MADGDDFFDLGNSALRSAQEALIKTFSDELNGYDNIFFEIINEATFPASATWQQTMVSYAQTYESGKAKQHVWGVTGDYPGPCNVSLESGNHEWWSPIIADSGQHNFKTDAGDATYDTMPVVIDTDHLNYNDYMMQREDSLYQGISLAWKSFTRGSPYAFMDCYTAIWTNHGVDACTTLGVNTFFDPVRDAMGATVAYSQRFSDLAAMVPSASIASTGYCLANPGVEYLVYQPETRERWVGYDNTDGVADSIVTPVSYGVGTDRQYAPYWQSTTSYELDSINIRMSGNCDWEDAWLAAWRGTTLISLSDPLSSFCSADWTGDIDIDAVAGQTHAGASGDALYFGVIWDDDGSGTVSFVRDGSSSADVSKYATESVGSTPPTTVSDWNETSSEAFCIFLKYLVPLSELAFTVRVPAAGTYNYEWFDARNDTLGINGQVVLSAGSNSFTPPFGNAVLYLRKSPSASIRTKSPPSIR